MKRYRLFLIILVLIIPAVGFSQTTQINSKLINKFGSEYLEKLKVEHPDRLAYLNYCADNQCYIIDMPGKPVPAIELTKNGAEEGYQITSADLENFNMYDFNIVASVNDQKYYRAGNTGKMIIVRSEKTMLQKYENYKSIK
ncbi:MAG: hypothetical protein A2W91_16925 [Bacteroidetes bacterium GWF2_38_335]|nr:MAG: hypothetical protein A2W91_16925 [Bacteroidetes bacterium GWF2_38_335]OFY81368.1 MAG: hypothetical protein A2281_07900 [Bacteroidetes bacterium RIFOXYA12_FULL_38_20]HBS85491.1 hypothetical protein [Bacteroidales bacterium]